MTHEDAGAPQRRAGRTTALVLAAAVVATELVLVITFVVLVVLDEGWSRWIWAALGALLLWQLVPRPVGPSPRAVLLGADQAAGVHRLVSEVSEALLCRRPGSVAVDTAYATTLVPAGYPGRTMLVVGLPQWTALDDDERLAALAHELACGEGMQGAGGTLLRLADDLLTRLALLFSPPALVQPHEKARDQSDSTVGVLGAGDELAGERFRREVAAGVGNAGLSVLGAPARALLRALRRALRPSRDQGCLAADRAAAALVGPAPTLTLLLSTLPTPRAWVAAEVAARRKGDPFAAMVQAERPSDEELARRLAAAAARGDRVGTGHAPTAVRVEALRRGGVVVTRGVGPASVHAADLDLQAARADLSQRFAEELVHGRS